jgi:hypothetical protein
MPTLHAWIDFETPAGWGLKAAMDRRCEHAIARSSRLAALSVRRCWVSVCNGKPAGHCDFRWSTRFFTRIGHRVCLLVVHVFFSYSSCEQAIERFSCLAGPSARRCWVSVCNGKPAKDLQAGRCDFRWSTVDRVF